MREGWGWIRRRWVGQGRTGRHGNQIKGYRHHFAKLNDDAVRFIRLRLLPLRDYALLFGVSMATISKVQRRKRYCHVADEPQEAPRALESPRGEAGHHP